MFNDYPKKKYFVNLWIKIVAKLGGHKLYRRRAFLNT
jgi:hypothetical protein